MKNVNKLITELHVHILLMLWGILFISFHFIYDQELLYCKNCVFYHMSQSESLGAVVSGARTKTSAKATTSCNPEVADMLVMEANM